MPPVRTTSRQRHPGGDDPAAYAKVRHGLGPVVPRRPVRDRLGGRPQVHQRLHPLLAVRGHRRFMIVSMALLGLSVRTLPIGTAYAVWTGIGAVGTFLLGIVLFREPAQAARFVCVGLLAAVIIVMKVVAKAKG